MFYVNEPRCASGLFIPNIQTAYANLDVLQNSAAGNVNSPHKARNQRDGKLLCFKLPLSLVKLMSAYSLCGFLFDLRSIICQEKQQNKTTTATKIHKNSNKTNKTKPKAQQQQPTKLALKSHGKWFMLLLINFE